MATKKASAKSQAVSAVAALSLTKKKPKSSVSTEKLEVTGFEKIIPQMRQRRQEMDDLEAAQKIDEAKVLHAVKKERLEAEKKGAFYRSCLVQSDDGKPSLVSFSDSFSKLETENEEILRDALGDNYDALVNRVCDIKVRAGITADRIKEVVGEEAFDKLLTVVELDESLVFSKDFMQRRATLRPKMSAELNDAIDTMVDTVQRKPSVRLK